MQLGHYPACGCSRTREGKPAFSLQALQQLMMIPRSILVDDVHDVPRHCHWAWPTYAVEAAYRAFGSSALQNSALCQVTGYTTCCSGIGSAEVGLRILQRSFARHLVNITAECYSSQVACVLAKAACALASRHFKLVGRSRGARKGPAGGTGQCKSRCRSTTQTPEQAHRQGH